MTGTLRIGLVGAGQFAAFALHSVLAHEDVALVAVADIDEGRARSFAASFRAEVATIDEVVDGRGLDVVYVATPPSTHAALGLRAARAGIHVICEKPFATTVAEADELVAVAADRGTVAVANLMQRYGSFADGVRRLVEAGTLGAPIRASLENWAADEGLPIGHWFWDRRQSGGIFVEHAVHFFDLFASWFGPGQVIAAGCAVRPGEPSVEDQVWCTVRHGNGVVVDQYHGFHQATRMDRMHVHVLFERGDVHLAGWIPVEVWVRALGGPSIDRELAELLGPVTVVHDDALRGIDREIVARHHPFAADRDVVVAGGDPAAKADRYADQVRLLFTDQFAHMRDRGHRRRLDEGASRDSVVLAVAADELAHECR